MFTRCTQQFKVLLLFTRYKETAGFKNVRQIKKLEIKNDFHHKNDKEHSSYTIAFL